MDTETTGLDYLRDKPFLLSVKELGQPAVAVRWDDRLVEMLTDRLGTLDKDLVFHNTKYDLHMFMQGGISESTIRGIIKPYCTMITEILLDEHMRAYNLNFLGKKYFDMGKDELKGWDKGDLINAPIEDVAKYAKRDVEITARLYEMQVKRINEQGIQQIHEIEMATTRTLVFVERRGVPVNESLIDPASRKVERVIVGLTQEITDIVGGPVNVNSPKQMKAAFDKLKIVAPTNTAGNPTFAKTAIKHMTHPFPVAVLSLRSALKMKDTFIATIRKHLNNGKVHTNLNQLRNEDFGTITGRLSSSGPNLQQVPSPKRGNPEMAKAVRSLFMAPEGCKWLSGDWSQFEFRIFAHYTREPFVLDAYANDPATDFHTMVSELTGVRRNPDAKQINLGLIFGMGDGKLAQTLNLPVVEIERYGKMVMAPGPEAKGIFDQYHSKFPGAKKFLRLASSIAKKRGYVKTICGRHLRFPRGLYTHKAGGLVFQGSAADIMKQKLTEIDEYLYNEQTGAELALTVHDEFDVIVPDEYTEEITKGVNEIMSDVPELRIPILADVKVGQSWHDASS